MHDALSFLFFFRRIAEFFLIEADEKGEVGEAAELCRLGYVVFAALQEHPGVLQTDVVSVFNGRFARVLPEQPPESYLAHVT